MHNYIINEIKVSFPDNLQEIQSIFATLLNNNKSIISFINPEIFMKQEDDPVLHSYFKNCKYNFIDGIGLIYAINKHCQTSFGIDSRYPGTDFLKYLPTNREIKIFLYGSKHENVVNAKKKIESSYSTVKIIDFLDGYTAISDEELIDRINCMNIDILIVCLGCPKQEYWIERNYKKINAKIIFGNGGSIDFWSGSVKRAPAFFINHGLEFIYRLFQNFTLKRIKRQFKLLKFYFAYNSNCYKIQKSLE